MALWSLDGPGVLRTQTSVPAAILSMGECVAFILLSYLEHLRSVGPPLLLNAYLLLSVLLDAIRIRTLWLRSTELSISVLFSVCVVLKGGVLITEEIGKTRWILPSKRPLDGEVTGGIFKRTLFVWLDRMLLKGYSTALAVITLPNIDADLLSDSLWERVGRDIEKSES